MTSLYHEMGTLSAWEPFSGSGRTSLGVRRPFISGSLNLNGPSRVIVRV